MARKFSTADQASGILSILDLLQIGSEALTRAVDKLDWDRMKDEKGKWRPQNEIEQTLKSFLYLTSLSSLPTRLLFLA